MSVKYKLNQFARGFSLLEMAIVLIILGFVLGAILAPIQAQRQQLAQSQTENTLEIAKKALLGYAQANGRLPCPAIAASNGLENLLGGVPCTSQLGYLPAATLGIQPTDENGFALDAWNNRIMYAVAQNSTTAAPPNTATPDFTTNNATDGMNVIGIAALTPELRVCNSATGVTATACSGGTEANYLINNAVAVIYSLGATGKLASGGADENLNPNLPTAAKRVFVSHDVRAADANGEFDHMVVWISPFVLYNAMIEAGQLH
ncbi:MAG: type II secretion system protein [Methylotenera sp.]|nr:type II secretion system protein [Methylotenera sp.]